MRRPFGTAALGTLLVLVTACGDHGDGSGETSSSPTATAATATSVTTAGDASTGGVPTSGADAGDADAGDASSEGTTGPATPPGPWDHGVFIPAEPQVPGDPAKGYDALLSKGYITCGIPWLLFGLAKPVLGAYADGEPLPGRPGKNADVPHNWTVHSVDGAEIVSQNCLQCHAGHFNGKLTLGLGTADADFTQDMSGMLNALPIPNIPIPGIEQMTRLLNRYKVLGPQTVMRTVGTNPAEAVAITLVAHRDRHTLEWHDEALLDLPHMVVPSDPPPWWRAHKKNALFYNGMARGDHRGTMMLATALCTDTVAEAQQIDSYFNDIQAYIRSVRAPEYPFTIDAALASEGEAVFAANCAGCHGTYADSGQGDENDTYPNLLFPLGIIGTDPVVAQAAEYAPELVEWYNESFYGSITRMTPEDPFPGYMAPPLDGVWATGPFLHNGSVPTIELVLDSSKRPKYWKRQDFDSAHFDEETLGWPYIEVAHGHAQASDSERKFIYDTMQFAHANTGHTFGDHLGDVERRAVLEYLKTL